VKTLRAVGRLHSKAVDMTANDWSAEPISPLRDRGRPDMSRATRHCGSAISHSSTVVTCTEPGDLKWISMGLRLHLDAQIEAIIICYEVSNARSFISQVRLAEMTTPDHATAIHDDPERPDFQIFCALTHDA
jgi:hypothetical protein